MPNSTLRTSGSRKPTARPYCQPRIRPQISTGMCIGRSIFPTAGIWPMKSGRIRPIAKSMPERVTFFTFSIFLIPPFVSFWNRCIIQVHFNVKTFSTFFYFPYLFNRYYFSFIFSVPSGSFMIHFSYWKTDFFERILSSCNFISPRWKG